MNRLTLFITFSFFIIFISCHSYSNNLLTLIKHQTKLADTVSFYKIIITHDTECQTCLWHYQTTFPSADTAIIGLYYVQYEPKFINILRKINPAIEWKRIKSDSIYNLLMQQQQRHGPFTIITDGEKIIRIE